MPKGSPELTEKRKNEILNACEKIYREKGFLAVSIKEISTQISLTRPAIYNYFETKGEIFLGVLARAFEIWLSQLQNIADGAAEKSLSELASDIAHTLDDKDILLRILNMNLIEIEENCRIERLATFKKLLFKEISVFKQMLRAFNPEISEEECEHFCTSFNAFLFGVYPFTHQTEKQKLSLQMCGGNCQEPEKWSMIYHCLIRLIPDRKN